MLDSVLSLRPALRFGLRPALRFGLRPALRFGLIGVFHYTMVIYFCEMIRLIYILTVRIITTLIYVHLQLIVICPNTNTYTFNVFSTGIAFSNDGVACDCVWSGGIVSGYVVHMEHPTDVPE